MKIKTRIMMLAIVGMIGALLYPNYSQAALQSNGGPVAKYTMEQWITGIRQMQAIGGSLGLTDTISGGNLKSNNNDLDIHMEKNTEYGAMVILSASSYGNPSNIGNGGTTTGNKTGAVINIAGEWVAAGSTSFLRPTVTSASPRYWNNYGNTYAEKAGDAIAGVSFGAGAKSWISSWRYADCMSISGGCRRTDWQYGGLVRATDGSLWAYDGRIHDQYISGGSRPCRYYNGCYRNTYGSRAVVVVGKDVGGVQI